MNLDIANFNAGNEIEKEFTYKDFIDLMYKDDKGFISVFRKGFKGIYQRHYRKFEIKEALDGFFKNDYTTDLYTSINTFIKPERTLESLRYLNALYIDIDCYKLNLRKESVLYFLENDYYGSLIPEPTLVVDSGRGLTLYWKIESVPSKAFSLWKALQYYLYNTLKELGADINALDASRILRVIGSHNTKSYTDVKVIEYNKHNLYSLKELKEDYLPKIEKKEKVKKKFKGKIVKVYNEFTLYKARLDDLEKLLEFRGYDIDNREVFLFLYRYYAEILEGTERALDMALELNSKFIRPLSCSEVIHSCKSNYIGKYNYSNDKIIEIFSISEEEQNILGTIKSKKVKYAINNERRKKERRNENGLTNREQEKRDKMYAVFKGMKRDLKTKEIAEILEISIRMVQKYKKELNNNDELMAAFEKMYQEEALNKTNEKLLISHIIKPKKIETEKKDFIKDIINKNISIYTKDTGT